MIYYIIIDIKSKMILKLILAVCIVIILIIVAYCVIKYVDESARNYYRNKARRANGFDNNAREAYVGLGEIREPRADDHYLRGALLLDLLDDNFNLNGADEIRRAINDHFTIALYNIPRGNVDNPDHIVYTVAAFPALFGVAGEATTEMLQQRAEAAANTTDTKQEAVDQFFTESIKYTNDRQNVHDPKVNNDLRDTLSKIYVKLSADELNELMREIREAVNASPKCANATLALDRFTAEVVSTFDCRNDEILACAWRRCAHPLNHERQTEMQNAIIDALADCVENDAVVCVNGRCARILGALVLLDFDETVGRASTFEIYKNQILEESNGILNDTIEELSGSSDNELSLAARSYRDPSLTPDDAAELRFKQIVMDKIIENINKYEKQLSLSDRDKITEYCSAALSI